MVGTPQVYTNVMPPSLAQVVDVVEDALYNIECDDFLRYLHVTFRSREKTTGALRDASTHLHKKVDDVENMVHTLQESAERGRTMGYRIRFDTVFDDDPYLGDDVTREVLLPAVKAFALRYLAVCVFFERTGLRSQSVDF